MAVIRIRIPDAKLAGVATNIDKSFPRKRNEDTGEIIETDDVAFLSRFLRAQLVEWNTRAERRRAKGAVVVDETIIEDEP